MLGNSGTWTVSWTDTNGAAAFNLPIKLDLEIGLFAGNNGSDYLLKDVTLPANPTSGSGTFDINFTNGGDKQPDLSHLTLTGGNATQLSRVPEPASIALLGAGLIGLGAMRRQLAGKRL